MIPQIWNLALNLKPVALYKYRTFVECYNIEIKDEPKRKTYHTCSSNGIFSHWIIRHSPWAGFQRRAVSGSWRVNSDHSAIPHRVSDCHKNTVSAVGPNWELIGQLIRYSNSALENTLNRRFLFAQVIPNCERAICDSVWKWSFYIQLRTRSQAEHQKQKSIIKDNNKLRFYANIDK